MTQPPRILYIVNTLDQGGAEHQLYYLLKYLRPDGEVLSLAPGGYWGPPMRELGYQVTELPRAGSFDVHRLRAVINHIRQQRPDIVHIFMDGVPGAYGRMATLLTGHRHTLIGVRNHPARDPRWYTLAKRYFLSAHIPYVVSNALSSQRYMIEQEGLPAAKARYIPNGLELDHFAPSSAPARKDILPTEWRDKVIIGTVGALAARKSPEVFVRVARRLLDQTDDVRFVHAGDGNLRESTHALAQALGVADRICFLGSRSDVPAVLQALDIFLMTSSNEGTPNAAMEAMATGLPCVLTDIGDCRDLMGEGELGYVAPVSDVEALANHALRLVQDANLRQRMGEAAHAAVQAYDVQKMADQYGDLYAEMLGAAAISKGTVN
ncbi:MAG: glycosyltransferase [Anaerolineae bacterium]|nr:glycosyltransferase [Anaerolineae bacterium]